MTPTAEVFRDRFDRIVASLEKATGNKHIAWLSTLSIVTGAPLLIESKTVQTKLARAVASAIHGVFDFTHGFDLQFKRFSAANVFYVEGLDALYCKAPSLILEHQSERIASKTENVFIVIARIGPQGRRFTVNDAVLNRFASFAEVDFDGEGVSEAEGVVSLAEVLEMRNYVKEHIGIGETVVAFVRKLSDACEKDSPVIPDELEEYVQIGPSPRAFFYLTDLSKVVAASQGRTQVECDDVRMLVETTMTHRFTTVGVSPFNRFDLGHRIVKVLLAKIPNEPAHA